MTTSGTYTFNYNRDQIIRAAYRKIGAIRAGEIPSAQMTQDGADALNAMVKEWEASGIHLWTEKEGYLFLQPNQIRYQIGPGELIDQSTLDFFQTASTSGIAQGGDTISLTSISGTTINGSSTIFTLATGYYIGIVLNSGAISWSTVQSVSGTTITLNTAASGPANANNTVFCFQSQINVKPLRMPFGRRLYVTGQTPIYTPMIAMSRKDYYDLPNKNDTGTMTQFYYSPRLNVGNVSVWPAAVNTSSLLEFTWYCPIQDFNVAGDDPDLPQEWISTIIFGLAIEMAPEYGVPADVYGIINTAFEKKMDKLSGWDREDQSVQFGVDMTWSGG